MKSSFPCIPKSKEIKDRKVLRIVIGRYIFAINLCTYMYCCKEKFFLVLDLGHHL